MSVAYSYLSDRVAEKKRKLKGVGTDLQQEFPTQTTVNILKSYSIGRGLSYVDPRLRRAAFKIKEQFGIQAMAAYHKQVLLDLIDDVLTRPDLGEMPYPLKDLYYEWFEQVINTFSSQTDDYYSLENDEFLKDLAVCSLRATPVGGAWLVLIEPRRDHSSGSARERGSPVRHRFLSYELVFRRWLRDVLSKLGLMDYSQSILVRLGAYKFYYVIHTVNRYLPRFTQEEMNKAYVVIAKLLVRNPSLKGLYRRSWFLDPCLENITPDLGYLREVPRQNGARFFPEVTSPSEINNALRMSAVRRRLHQEGQYEPRSYSYVWPRDNLLAWARIKSGAFVVAGDRENA
ncbi:hypothetical protein ACFLRM_05120 [Acidobacteriota bacterium]